MGFARRVPGAPDAGRGATLLATLFFAWIPGSRGFKLVINNWDIENVAVPFALGVVYLIVPAASLAIAAYAWLQLDASRRKLARGS